MRFGIYAIVLSMAVAAGVAFAGPLAAPKPAAYRLDSNATPEHYRIDITPDVAAMRFSGSEQIRVRLKHATRTVTMNAAELSISAAAADGARAQVALDDKSERLTLTFAHLLAAGEHRLTLAYGGKINTLPRGLFAVSYDDHGVKKTALGTQLESIDARRLFPGWDEPDHKAVFALSMVTPKGELAVSNMRVVSTRSAGAGRQRVTFAQTPRMSPYLVFLGAGDFVRVTRKAGPVEIGVVTTRDAAKNADFTLAAASELIPYYGRYFGAPYPLRKLDFFLMPGSGQPVGMENWGAVFGYENGFIVNPKTTTEGGRAFVYLVIAHELAHQWFGDLVTLKWWDDTWLNEGFASWLQVKVSTHFHPEWYPGLQAQGSRDGAMQVDAGNATHPVITPVDDPSKMDQIFDQITYDKGQGVISMLEAWLGEEPFRRAISTYVRANAYGSATTPDLWRTLRQADPRAQQVAEAFTTRPGVPLLTASIGPCVNNQRAVHLVQTRLTSDGSENAQPWPLPLRLGEAGATAAAARIDDARSLDARVAGCAPVVVNAGQDSYVRTAYDDQGFAELLTALPRLSPADQMGLIDDNWALAPTGVVGAERSLELLQALPAVTARPVWQEELSVLRSLDRAYPPGPARDRLRGFVCAVLRTAQSRTSDPSLSQDFQRALASYDDATAVAAAQADLTRLLAGQTLTPAEQGVALDAGVAHADAALYERVVNAMRGAASTDFRTRLLLALSRVSDEPLAKRTLDLTLEDDVAAGVTVEMLDGLAQRHGAMVEAFVQAHADVFDRKLRPVDRTQVKNAAQAPVDTPAQLKMKGRIDAWLASHQA
ncbi:MAG TPA: M1 family metallopeptidase [Caulobacteraceae bacterium]|jgi:aminopeptidase N